MDFIVLNCPILDCIVMDFVVLDCVVMDFIVLNCPILDCIVMDFVVLDCIAFALGIFLGFPSVFSFLQLCSENRVFCDGVLFSCGVALLRLQL